MTKPAGANANNPFASVSHRENRGQTPGWQQPATALASPHHPGFISSMPRKRKFTEILEEARGLPYGERAELIEQLIADSAKHLDPAIEKAWGDEALRRLKEIEDGKVQMIPGEVVAARMRKILGRQ